MGYIFVETTHLHLNLLEINFIRKYNPFFLIARGLKSKFTQLNIISFIYCYVLYNKIQKVFKPIYCLEY